MVSPYFTGSNISTVKSHNLRIILFSLLQQEYLSRVDLAKLTNLSTTTITNLITELLEQDIVVEERDITLERRPGAGRPRTAIRLVPESRYAIGIHIGVGKIRVAITDLRAHIVKRQSLDHPLEKSAEAVLADVSRLVQDTIEQSNIPPENIIGVGVGASGLVNPDTGINMIAPNLQWRDIPIRRWLQKQLGLPVCVDNNVRAMALGEALFGEAKNARVLAFVYARIGVGAGLVVDGQLYRGIGAGAGEIGHAKIIPEGGEPCRCGKTGCLETLVSENSIMRLAQELAGQEPESILAACLRQVDAPTIEQVFAAARAGDTATQSMLVERARYMGIALSNLVNLLNPELILLGGIFAQGKDLLLPSIQETVRQYAFADLGKRVQIKPTTFGQNAGVIGGAALALTTFFYEQPEIFVPRPMPEVIT